MSAIIREVAYPRFKTKHPWHYIDTDFQNGAGSVSLALLHIKAAYTSFMNVCIKLPLRLPKVQDQKPLTCGWLSFSGWGRERFSRLFDNKGGQFIRKGQWYTYVNMLRLAIRYLNVTVNRNTRKREQKIGTDRSGQPRPNLWVDVYGSGFGLPWYSRSDFWTGLELNGTVLAVGTQTSSGLPGPVANTRQEQLGVCTGPSIRSIV
jgi:hypothetical protein